MRATHLTVAACVGALAAALIVWTDLLARLHPGVFAAIGAGVVVLGALRTVTRHPPEESPLWWRGIGELRLFVVMIASLGVAMHSAAAPMDPLLATAGQFFGVALAVGIAVLVLGPGAFR